MAPDDLLWQRRTAYGALVVVAMVLLYEINLHPLFIAPDAAVHVEAAKLLLSGKRIYVEFLDADPPLISYITTLPVCAAQLLKLNVCQAFSLFVWLLSVLSSFLVIRLLFLMKTSYQSQFLSIIAVAFTLSSLLAGPEFGTMTHLLVLLSMPYFVTRWLGIHDVAVPRGQALAAGVLAGIAFNLDWSYYLYPVAYEILLRFQRPKDPFYKTTECQALLAVTALYIAHFFCLPEQAQANYMQVILPITTAISEVWDASYAYTAKAPDRRDVFYIFFAFAIPALALRKKCTFIMPMAIVFLCCFEIFVYKVKGYSWQLLPAMTSTLIIAATTISYASLFGLRKIIADTKIQSPIYHACISLFVILAATIFVTKHEALFNLHNKETGAAVADIAPLVNTVNEIAKPGETVLFITESLRPGYPLLVQLDLQTGSHFLYQFPARLFCILKFVPEDNKFHHLLDLEKLYLATLKNDIETIQPRFIFMQTGDLKESLAANITAEVIEPNYELIKSIGFEEYKEREDPNQNRLEWLGHETAFDIFQLDENKIRRRLIP